MKLYWLEQTEADVPASNDWLSEPELVRLASLRFPKRRADWRLGRWTAKNAAAACLRVSNNNQALTSIEIRAAQSGAPEVFIRNDPAKIAISLSHRNGRAACAVGPISSVAMGCDLEISETHSDAFIGEYFTAEEQGMVAVLDPHYRSGFVTLLWSAKESALKALREGLRLSTREVRVELDPQQFCNAIGTAPEASDGDCFKPISWFPLQVSSDHRIFGGWWNKAEHLVRTVVAEPDCDVPSMLKILDGTTSQVGCEP